MFKVMSSQPAMALDEIRRAGVAALFRELGPVGAIRFLQQYEARSGDYSRDRHSWLGNPGIDEIAEQLRRSTASEAPEEA
ncbi:MAG TPA: hypothetical protein VFR81_14620 [Longimicrobium sp.]|nr:hypothetical protein [Longimicrobium sp.]